MIKHEYLEILQLKELFPNDEAVGLLPAKTVELINLAIEKSIQHYKYDVCLYCQTNSIFGPIDCINKLCIVYCPYGLTRDQELELQTVCGQSITLKGINLNRTTLNWFKNDYISTGSQWRCEKCMKLLNLI